MSMKYYKVTRTIIEDKDPLKGCVQKEVAEEAKIDQAYFSRILNGVLIPSEAQYNRIIEAVNKVLTRHNN